MKLTFAIDLTDFDITDFEKNPVVSYDFDYTQPPIGKAKISEDKKSVEVEFAPHDIYPFGASVADLVNKYNSEFSIAPAYTQEQGTLNKRLLDISVIAGKAKK